MTEGAAGARPEVTAAVTKGARRHLAARDVASLVEFTPHRGLRVDLFAVGRDGEIWIVEVKSSLEDLRADAKWPAYRDWCDRLFFAVPRDFPVEALSDEVGVIIADGFGAETVREAPAHPLAAARRKTLIRNFARQAARRLHRLEDADFAQLGVES